MELKSIQSFNDCNLGRQGRPKKGLKITFVVYQVITKV